MRLLASLAFIILFYCQFGLSRLAPSYNKVVLGIAARSLTAARFPPCTDEQQPHFGLTCRQRWRTLVSEKHLNWVLFRCALVNQRLDSSEVLLGIKRVNKVERVDRDLADVVAELSLD